MSRRWYVVGHESTFDVSFLALNEVAWETTDPVARWDGCSAGHAPTLYTYRQAKIRANELGFELRAVGERLLRICTDYQRECVLRAVKYREGIVGLPKNRFCDPVRPFPGKTRTKRT